MAPLLSGFVCRGRWDQGIRYIHITAHYTIWVFIGPNIFSVSGMAGPGFFIYTHESGNLDYDRAAMNGDVCKLTRKRTDSSVKMPVLG